MNSATSPAVHSRSYSASTGSFPGSRSISTPSARNSSGALPPRIPHPVIQIAATTATAVPAAASRRRRDTFGSHSSTTAAQNPSSSSHDSSQFNSGRVPNE